MKTASTWLFLGILAVSLAYGNAPLRAQPASAPAVTGGDDRPWNRGVSREIREAARDLFLEGNRLFRVPLFAQAAEKYIAALGKWKHPAFYFNLALAQLNLGQEVEARGNLEQALRHGEEPLGAEQFKEARKQLQDVERQLGRIHVSCPTPGAEITLDGATLFSGPGSRQAWVKARAHEITAKKRGYLSEAQRVTITPGAVEEVDLRLVTLSEAADTGRRWTAWKPWAVVASGGAVAVTAGVLHTLSARNFSNYDKQFRQLSCANTTGCAPSDIAPSLAAQLSRATREQQIAVGGYIAGGSVLAAGILLVYLNRPHLPEQQTPSTAARNVTVTPAVSTDSFGILMNITR